METYNDFIFDKYIDDKCPVCNSYVDSESFSSHTEHGGKCMAKYFTCPHCFSQYIVGFERSSMPISSEIITVGKLNKD